MTVPPLPRYPLPDGVRERVQASVRLAAAAARAPAPGPVRVSRPPSRFVASRSVLQWASACAAALLVTVSATTYVNRRDDAAERELAAVVDSHLRALVPGHLADVASTDRHTVKPWFTGRVAFAPLVVDHAAEGFVLTGGRVDVVDGQTVAALVYSRHSHIVNVFVRPLLATESPRDRTTARRGFNAVEWTHDGMRFWAVSDVDVRELLRLRDLLRLPPDSATTEPARDSG